MVTSSQQVLRNLNAQHLLAVEKLESVDISAVDFRAAA
jgi:hypothetical protein